MKKHNPETWNDSHLWDRMMLAPSMDSKSEISANSIGIMPLMKKLLESKAGHLTEFHVEGHIKKEELQLPQEPELLAKQDYGKKYLDWLHELGGRLIYKHISDGEGSTLAICLWQDTIVEFNLSGTWMSFSGLSHQESFIRELVESLKSQWKPTSPEGTVYAIMSQNNRLSLGSIGNAGISLVEGNYHPMVLEDYKFVIKDLRSSVPSGRIVVMKGKPGTGKTHLIRAMTLEVADAMFVLVSPEMVPSLSGPELLPLLLQYKSGTGPIILLLEDADKCLVARDSGNINSIQALLNLGDGILGSLLDLRIVATTNADQLEMEPAMMRPGRLSKMLDVGSLDLPTAQKIFTRLLPSSPFPVEINESVRLNDFQMTLAEVYALARKCGWEPDVRKIEATPQSRADEDYN